MTDISPTPPADTPDKPTKGGWKRTALAVLAVFLIWLALGLVGILPRSVYILWVSIAAVVGWLAYRGRI